MLERWGRDEQRLDIEEILEIEGSASVVVRYRMKGRSHAGVPLDHEWVHVFEFRDERIARGRNFTSMDAAAYSLGEVSLSRLWSSAEANPLG